ncbi:MAG: DUF3821 domain-containing protein, partial [Methanoregula sp.]|nr:DUF3821 domain-containing protein [Methanoregula sp.]
MTKRLTIALIALAMFVLVAVMPVSAANVAVSTYTQTALNVNAGGASVYIGEQGLNLAATMNAARAVAVPATTSTQIGWWASAAVIT